MERGCEDCAVCIMRYHISDYALEDKCPDTLIINSNINSAVEFANEKDSNMAYRCIDDALKNMGEYAVNLARQTHNSNSSKLDELKTCSSRLIDLLISLHKQQKHLEVNKRIKLDGVEN